LTPHPFLQDPKIVVGSSDLTFLLLYLLSQCGLGAFHGPMVAPNFGHVPSPLTDDFFLKVLSPRMSDQTLAYPSVEVLKDGVGEGVLTGGCLSMVCESIGTTFEIQTEGHILFLEDIQEPPFRIDRMINYLKAAGKLKGVRGIIFGKMEQCHPLPEAGYTLQEVLLDSLIDFEGPILYGFPSGHGADNVTLPFGVRVLVDGKTGGVTLLEPAVIS
jgi:muramoyltetrapeptide carboxypeptidase